MFQPVPKVVCFLWCFCLCSWCDNITVIGTLCNTCYTFYLLSGEEMDLGHEDLGSVPWTSLRKPLNPFSRNMTASSDCG